MATRGAHLLHERGKESLLRRRAIGPLDQVSQRGGRPFRLGTSRLNTMASVDAMGIKKSVDAMQRATWAADGRPTNTQRRLRSQTKYE
jgi:hypothetical protein